MGTASRIACLPVVSQRLLDLDAKERSNLFPWRGQFSPELVEVLLKTYAVSGDVVLDPFAGVGTTLLEACKLGMRGRGTELNPSAFLMAQAVEWVRYPLKQRDSLLRDAALILEDVFSSEATIQFDEHPGRDRLGRAKTLARLAKDETTSLDLRHIFANILIRGLGDECRFYKAFQHHSKILRSLPHTDAKQSICHCDARQTPFSPSSVDLILTSPPYINVFNYHENNRPAMEMLGWDILSVAKAELGSNRKNRGNRFITVIQYCLDMHAVFVEMQRVLRATGSAIFVVGRESMVRGVPFENGQLVASIAASSGFELALRQERRFTNRFGQSIFEDILHLIPSEPSSRSDDSREVAVAMLESKLTREIPNDVRQDLMNAIAVAEQIEPSPIYNAW